MMSEMRTLSPMVPPDAIGKAIARRGHIWQMDFLSADELAEFVSAHGLKFWSQHIIQLWRRGLLRADYIAQTDRARRIGFRYLGTDRTGRSLYADVRRGLRFPEGWASAALDTLPVGDEAELYFHPFRYLVLVYLDSVLRFATLPIHSLRPPRHFYAMWDDHLQHLEAATRSSESVEEVDKWNDIASLAALTEPAMYTRIFGHLRRPSYVSEHLQQQRLHEHWSLLVSVFKGVGLDRIHIIREALCWETLMLEPNEDVHTLLRLAGREDRLKLEGRLGGALVVRTMNEMIRRTAEEVFETELPEEDVHPVRLGAVAVKENNYGSRRLLDGNWDAADEFAREFGLRFGPHVRWYVEGDTEYGAVCRLRSLLGAYDVAVVNLHGIIKDRRKEFASALRAALKADRESRTFSFISIDDDVLDHVKVLRLAARNDLFCGAFFLATPNFECHNFTKDELEAILWDIAHGEGAVSTDYRAYKNALQDWDYKKGDVDTLLRLAENALRLHHGALHKGESWGQRLMDYAWEHPRQPRGTLRDILQTIRLLHIARTTNYHITQRDYRVDPITGNMIKRDA